MHLVFEGRLCTKLCLHPILKLSSELLISEDYLSFPNISINLLILESRFCFICCNSISFQHTIIYQHIMARVISLWVSIKHSHEVHPFFLLLSMWVSIEKLPPVHVWNSSMWVSDRHLLALHPTLQRVYIYEFLMNNSYVCEFILSTYVQYFGCPSI